MTKTTSRPYESKFDLKTAIRLARNASTARTRSPFADKPEELLQVLQAAEEEFYFERHDPDLLERDPAQLFGAERRNLEEFEGHFERFRYHWKKLSLDEKLDLFEPMMEEGIGILDEEKLQRIFGRNRRDEVFELCLEMIGAYLPLAINVRCQTPDGPKEQHPELKAFVRHIKWVWERCEGAPRFGHSFEISALHYPDKRPVSAAAILVFDAAQILDSSFTGKDCHMAMRAVSEER